MGNFELRPRTYFSRENSHLFLTENRRLYLGELYKRTCRQINRRKPLQVPQLSPDLWCIAPSPCHWPRTQWPNYGIYVHIFSTVPCILHVFICDIFSFMLIVFVLWDSRACHTAGGISTIFPVTTSLTHMFVVFFFFDFFSLLSNSKPENGNGFKEKLGINLY